MELKLSNAKVERREINNKQYLVAKNVTLVKPLEDLDGGYVPEKHLQKSANQWRNKPITLYHPRDKHGNILSAQNPEVYRETGLGHIQNPRYKKEEIQGDIAVDIEKAKELGNDGELVIEKIENKKPLPVSTQYGGEKLEPGRYDGEHREQVIGNIRPDGLALIPRGDGRCSIQDGCGFMANTQKNQLQLYTSNDPRNPKTEKESSGEETNNLGIGMELDLKANIDYQITDISPEDVDTDDYTDKEWDGSEVITSLPNPSQDEEAPEILDDTHALIPQGEEARDNKSSWKLPFRSGPEAPINTRALVAIKAAASGARGGIDDVRQSLLDDINDWANELLLEAPDDLYGSMTDEESDNSSDMSENSLLEIGRLIVELVSGNKTKKPNSKETNSMDSEKREKLEKEILENSEMKEDSVESLGDSCLQIAHENIVGNNSDEEEQEGSGDDQKQQQKQTEKPLANMDEEKLNQKIEELAEEKAEEIVANQKQKQQKKQLAQKIVANSNEYEKTKEVIEDYPTEKALETKRDNLLENSGFPTQQIDPVGNSEDGDEIDVSSGVIG